MGVQAQKRNLSRIDVSGSYSAIRGERSVPIELMVASRTSPGLTNVPVVDPTPEGVPVEIMSPGSSVTKLEMNSITAATGKICCAVEASWRISLFSVNLSCRDWGSEMAEAEVIQGPQGQAVSCHFP